VCGGAISIVLGGTGTAKICMKNWKMLKEGAEARHKCKMFNVLAGGWTIGNLFLLS
jgi:hypothetical protein